MKHTAGWDGRVWSATVGARAVRVGRGPTRHGGRDVDRTWRRRVGGRRATSCARPGCRASKRATAPSASRAATGCAASRSSSRRAGTSPPTPTVLCALPVVIIAARDPSDRVPDPVLWVDDAAGDGFVAQRTLFFTNESLTLNEHRDVDHPRPARHRPRRARAHLSGGHRLEHRRLCRRHRRDDARRTGDAHRRDPAVPRPTRRPRESTCPPMPPTTRRTISKTCASRSAWSSGTSSPVSTAASSPRSLPATSRDGVRAVVVNSTPVPLQVDWFADLAPNAAQAWDALADALCRRRRLRAGLPRSRRASRSPGGRPHRRPPKRRRRAALRRSARPVPHERQPTARVCAFLRSRAGSSAVCR